ncbi:MAG: hypothetical protein LQ352_005091 [Teloschistes flavicans]|nr:MAG: hypothetical protein LQ352_005091 [Teloschistes flavicans]
MANGTTDNTVYGPDLSLTPSQQSLLRTALSSNNPDTSVSKRVSNTNISPSDLSAVASSGNMLPVQENPGRQNDSIYRSPDQSALNPITDPFNLDDTPFIDGHDFEDANFDWDDTEEQLFGDLPGESALGNGIHDKRKNNDDDENEDGKNKRHEGNEKNSKKPGRKPLNSSEPTTKRKAQNRAAQRAFRERKERHLKDLEVKVEDLEKASEATNHENGRLRATVDRLNSEVREYRQRLSLNAPNYSPPRTQAPQHQTQDSNSDFHFAFPKFGNLPGSTFMSNGSLTRTSTPNKGPLRTSSGNIPDSSCGTTPEPSADTQDHRKPSEGTLRTINEESALSSDEKRKFCGTWANSCGDSTNPVPRDSSQPEIGATPPSNVARSPVADINGIDWMARENGGQFDPVLFGDYRDTQNDLFSNEFFSDAFLSQDFSTPFNMPEDVSPVGPIKEPKKNLMQQVEEQQNADYDEIVPGQVAQYLNCDKLWLVSALALVHGSANLLRDRVKQSERAQSGDMNSLCAELKSKAKCSGSGAVIEQKDVDAILGPPPDEQKDFLSMFK